MLRDPGPSVLNLGTQPRVGDRGGDFIQEVRYYKGPRFSHVALIPELGSRLGVRT